jgi:hypothetical protein
MMAPENPMTMRTYRLLLSFGVVIVEAERYCESETVVVFYRGGLVSAEYPRAIVIVKEVTEVKVPQGRCGAGRLH